MTEQTRFTPGPWKARCFRGVVSVHGPEGDCISHCNGVVSPNKANAQLIAAAPDMYKALKALLDGYTTDPEKMFRENLSDLMFDAGMALARAEGREH